MKTICICGGGNLGHTVSGYIAAQGSYNVNILTNHPEKWGHVLQTVLPGGSVIEGKLQTVSNNPAEVIPNADIIFICLPGAYIREELTVIKPFLNSKAAVGTVVSSTGFFFQAHDILSNQSLFGFQRVPFISRIEEYGHKANLLGFKKSLNVCIENVANVEALCKTLEEMLGTPINLLNNFYEASLSNSNPLLHPSRLYTMWKDYKPGIFYKKQSYFYEEWTKEASQIYIDMDKEFQSLLKVLPIREGSIPSVLDYYESTDCESLTSKIRSIEAFKRIKSPMVQTTKGWIPDLNSRYFTEDFQYGLYFIRDIAIKKNIKLPHIETVCNWYSEVETQSKELL